MVERTSDEIREYFQAKGYYVVVLSYGTSYRAGGLILIVSPELIKKKPSSNDDKSIFYSIDWESGVEILENKGIRVFDPTGYRDRGRFYDLYKLIPGDWILVSGNKYADAPANLRQKIGDFNKISSDLSEDLYFVHRSYLDKLESKMDTIQDDWSPKTPKNKDKEQKNE